MLALVLASGFFSGSETAFFNLSRRESLELRDSHNKLSRLVFRLLKTPKKLLTALLFGNMLINVLFFAISSVISIDILETSGNIAGLLFAILSFITLVVFGEMLPKSIAYSRSKNIALMAALPCYILELILAPVIAILNAVIVEPIIRLCIPTKKSKQEFNISQIKKLIEISSKRGSITKDQNLLISEVLELSYLKLRHLMKPRVDMLFCDINDSLENAINIMMDNCVKKLPVYDGKIDNIQGVLLLRDALLNRNKPIRELITEAVFVPEQKSVESLMEFFKKEKLDIAIVVDEYGGVAGLLTMKDIISELLGASSSDLEETLKQVTEKECILSGSLAFHDWADFLGLEVENNSSSTLGGFVTTLIGKIPQKGDSVVYENIKFTVEEMDRYRVKSIRLTFNIDDKKEDDQQ